MKLYIMVRGSLQSVAVYIEVDDYLSWSGPVIQ